MPAITEARMRAFSPSIHQDILSAFLVHNADDILIEAGITDALILAHFLGQTYEETGGFTVITENLNYSASRLMAVFPSHFRTLASAQAVAGNAVKTANSIYGGRMGNVNPNDGWKFRGGGLLQLTGSDNYRMMARKTGVDLYNHPDLSRDPSTALEVAAQCFKALGADAAAAEDNVRLVTRIVNGGYINLDKREAATIRAKRIFTVNPLATALKSSDEPYGLISNFADLANSQTADQDPDARPMVASLHDFTPLSTVSAVPMTSTQAKQIQQRLKDLHFAPGDISGNIKDPGTIGAIAELQAQEGLPVTGIVDDATEDAIQNCQGKTVSQDRENDDRKTLKAKGSATIAAADSITNTAHAATVGGVGTVLVAGSGLIGQFKDQADQLKSVTDNIPGLTDRLGALITDHLQQVLALGLGVAILLIVWRLHTGTSTIVHERVRKARDGEE